MMLHVLTGCAGGWAVASAQTPAAHRGDTATQGDTTVAAQAGLAPEQVERLAALGIPVAVPAFVPAGFAVDTVHTRPGVPGNPLRVPTYAIRYAAPGGACFTIETTTGGLGGPAPPKNRRPVDSPLFPAPPGDTYHVFWTGADPDEPFHPRSLFSSWLKHERVFYRLTSGRMTAHQGCRRIDAETAARIVESLHWLPAPATAAQASARPPAGPADPFDRAAYDRYVLNRPFTITSAPDASPRAAALHVLEELGLALSENSRASQNMRVNAAHPDTTAVLVTHTDLRDDSVAGMRYLVEMYRTDGRWVLDLLGRQYRCQAKRGHQHWSKTLCR